MFSSSTAFIASSVPIPCLDTGLATIPAPATTPAPSPLKALPVGNLHFPVPAEREALLLAHLPQVHLLARNVRARTHFAVELDDLIGYGMLGLLDAVRKFDPSRGFLLKTYAEHRIRGAMLDGLRGMDWLSRSARRLARSGQHRDAPATIGNAPSGSGFVPALDCDTRSEREVHLRPTALFYGGEAGKMERLCQNSRHSIEMFSHAPSPERVLERKQERTALAEAIGNLPERQRNVLELYYQRELSMKRIAALLGVHASRISQIHLAAITRLRKSLTAIAPQSTRGPRAANPNRPPASLAEAMAG